MEITFDRGNREQPKGHALLYFRGASDPEEIWATYLVILPITVDISKYVPPFLMNQVGEIGPKDLSAFAFPPAPEKLQSYSYLEELAETRDDDILFAGTINPLDVPSALMSVNDAVQQYAESYSELASALHPPESQPDEVSSGLGVNEILYGLMSDSDKLGELTKLVGKVRYAVEGHEENLIKETEADISFLAKHLPENHHIDKLVEAAKAGGNRGAELAELYLQRCFHLVQEEYVKLGRIEEEIQAFEASESS